MAAVGIEYPGDNLVWNGENGSLELSSNVGMELGERMLEVVNGVAARYRELSKMGLLVVRFMCSKIAMSYFFCKFFY
jgi:hypothetical protein